MIKCKRIMLNKLSQIIYFLKKTYVGVLLILVACSLGTIYYNLPNGNYNAVFSPGIENPDSAKSENDTLYYESSNRAGVFLNANNNVVIRGYFVESISNQGDCFNGTVEKSNDSDVINGSIRFSNCIVYNFGTSTTFQAAYYVEKQNSNTHESQLVASGNMTMSGG